MRVRAWQRWSVGATLAMGCVLAGPALVEAQVMGGAAGTSTGGTGTGVSSTGGVAGTGGGARVGTGGGTTATGGNGFSGGTAGSSFSGGLGFSGGTGTGGIGIGTGTGTGAGRLGGAGAIGVGAPSASNLFRTTYVNPLSVGMYTVGSSSSVSGAASTTAAKPSFGQPLYPLSPTGTNTTVGGPGLGTGGLGGARSSFGSGTGQTGFNTFGTPRAPQHITTLHESLPRVQHSAPAVAGRLDVMLKSSTNLKKFGPLDVAVNAGAVTLRGTVSTQRERKLVEGMVRLTPGVREVKNELTVRGE